MKHIGRDQSNNDASPVSTHSSSIALLQERFKQLQRVKEMREERELLKGMAQQPDDVPGLTSNPRRDQFKVSARREPRLPPHSPPQVSLSLWPNAQSSNWDIQRSETPPLSSSGTTNANQGFMFDPNDVDTSLHL